MAAVSQTNTALSVNGSDLIFGIHKIPIGTAKSFTICFEKRVVDLVCKAANEDLFIRLECDTIAKVKACALLLFRHSQSFVNLDILKEMRPFVFANGSGSKGFIEFEFRSAKAAREFRGVYFPCFFGSAYTSRPLELNKEPYLVVVETVQEVAEKVLVDQMNAIFTQMKDRSPGRCVLDLLKTHGDPRFSWLGFPHQLEEYQSRSYQIFYDKAYHCEQTRIAEIPNTEELYERIKGDKQKVKEIIADLGKIYPFMNENGRLALDALSKSAKLIVESDAPTVAQFRAFGALLDAIGPISDFLSPESLAAYQSTFKIDGKDNS